MVGLFERVDLMNLSLLISRDGLERGGPLASESEVLSDSDRSELLFQTRESGHPHLVVSGSDGRLNFAIFCFALPNIYI